MLSDNKKLHFKHDGIMESNIRDDKIEHKTIKE